MQPQDILTKVDHTLLSPTATHQDIETLVEEGTLFHCASVCLPPAFVAFAKEKALEKAADASPVPICTVIGFPNGYTTTAAKCFEAQEAVRLGASEIDMVIELGRVKEGAYDSLLKEIDQVKEACEGRLLKVIIETCLLTEPEKIALCQVVSLSKADYIKTSTGFSSQGATREDIALMKAHVAPRLKIKAAGGIRSFEDAADFLALGASRLGTSRLVTLIKKGDVHV